MGNKVLSVTSGAPHLRAYAHWFFLYSEKEKRKEEMEKKETLEMEERENEKQQNIQRKKQIKIVLNKKDRK